MINFSSLTQYTDQLKMPLLREAVLGGQTIGLISLQTGIKYADSLNILNTTLTAQAGGCGAINATGSVTLSQRSLQVCNIKVEEAICLDQMEQYWLGMSMKPGSYVEQGPDVFNQAYNADKVAKINQLIENYAWKGSTTGTYSSSFTLCNGLQHTLELTSASQSVINGSGTFSGALTTANSIDILDTMVAALYANATNALEFQDLVAFMSISAFRTYTNAWIRSNNYHVNVDDAADLKNFRFTIPGTSIKIVGTIGLQGSNKIWLSSASNFYFGTDLVNDAEAYEIWFERRDNQLYFRAKFKIGFQVAYPQYVVKYNG
jgi:hypothetical protein